MSADSAVSIAWDFFKIVFVRIKRGFGYVMSSKSYADNLRQEVQNLNYEAQRVRSAEEVARNNLENIHAWVPGFLASAEIASQEARILLGEFERESKTCCRGTLPDPNCRYRFSRNAKHKTDYIKNLILENRNKEVSFSRLAPGNVAVQSTTSTASASSASTSTKLRDDGVFESRASVILEIMDALAYDTKSVVGVHGMGGVGKSTLLAEVEKRIREARTFDLVAKADVSENPDIKRIQGEIADALSLSNIKDKESVSGRAKLLRERLENEEREKKKVLIILDDLWEQLHLDKVGIPCGPDNKARGCKLLLTARDRSVLIREMRCDSPFLLGELEKEEAKRLFEKMVGGKVPVELEPLVEEALRICAGLPFLIVAIAKLFTDTTYSACKDDLKQIWSEETGEVINKTLRISYERIKSEKAKSLLQLIAVYGVSKPSLENLVRYGFGLGLFGEESSMEDARIRLNKHIKTLQDSSLLLRSEEGVGFKIHDLAREFVASVASRDHPLLVLKDESVEKLTTDKLKSCGAICFPYVDLEELPKELVCPELRIFLLFSNNESLEILDSYFNSMKNLSALHLTEIRLSCSPSPFQFLENLHSLCLEYCSVEDVAILVELKGLQILSLQGSDIQLLPKEIGQLVKLKLLDLSHCSRLEIIEPDVLGRLTNLEELYMEYSFDKWSVVDQTPATNASLMELNKMKKLRTLHVSICNLSVLPEDLNFQQLTNYRIRIGTKNHALQFRHRHRQQLLQRQQLQVQHPFQRPFERKLQFQFQFQFQLQLQLQRKYEGSRTLELNLNPTSVLPKGCIQSILCKTDMLFFNGLNGTKQSIWALSVGGFPQLKHLQVQHSPSIRYILEWSSLPAFKALETLLLQNMINLEKITSNDISSKSFGSLRVVRVKSCDKMEVLFPRSVAIELRQLEEIQVERCELMRGIVEADDDHGKFEWPNLRVLELCDLPKIRNFVTARSAPSSSTSNGQVGAQIAFLNGQQVNFPRLKTLQISGLGNLEFMFFPSMVKSLTQLRKLSVINCKRMEAIIMEEEGLQMETSETLAFPMLTVLSLGELESLTCFSHNKCLQETRSQDHIKSRSTVLFNQKVSFPLLESLTIEGLPNLKEIWSDESPLELSNLRSLKVKWCESLLKVISFKSLIQLPKLQSLCINDCSLVQEIFYCEGLSACGDVETLSQLTTLELNELGSLTRIWNKNPSGIVSFQNLKEFDVDDCDSLKFIFFPSMVKSLAKLRDLSISNCKKMEGIISEEEGLGMEVLETLAFPMLTNLTVTYLESLASFSRGKCSREARSEDCVNSRSTALFSREVAFPKLESLEIHGLDNLRFTFFPSMVKSLTQLRELRISNCKKMETIIMEEEGSRVEILETLAFPMLTDLSLERLESLTCFSREKCSQEGQSQDHVQLHSMAVFNREVAFPSLEKLYIEGMDNIEMIWNSQVAVDSFSKLNLLDVSKCNKLVNVVPSIVLGRLLSLERLEARSCDSLKVVFKFQPQNPQDGHFVARSPLKELKLFDLPMLECIWDKELHHQAIEGTSHELKVSFPFLESLKIEILPNLKEIWSDESPLELSNLQSLEVVRCDGLSNMFTPTMATNLVGLKALSISKCGLLTEVISDEGGREGHVVAFNQLMGIELDGLMGLRCFYSGGYTLMLPLLEEVIVTECLKMKFFSKGPIEASKLERVQVSKEVWFWKGNLNITIQHMFEEMGTTTGVKKMLLSKFPELIGKWHSELNPLKSSWQLKSLTVDKCPSFINAIPSRLMLVLKNLGTLQVRDCESLEEIFNLEGLENVESTQVLPSFMILDLVNLPKLRRLWNKDLQGLLPYNFLNDITLYKCNNLTHAFVPSMAQFLANLESMEIKECGQMEGVIAEEEGQGSAVENILFLKLKLLKLEWLPNLTSFLLGKNHTLECPKLEELTIGHCPQMRNLAWQSLMEVNNATLSLFTPQVQFPRLESIVLTHMDNLSKIWTDDPQETLTFDYLQKLKAQNCKSLENLFPQWVATSLNQLKKVRVESCGIEEIVANGGDASHFTTAQVLFPELTSLVLHDMPRLKSFCPNLPTLNWPFLNKLRVTHCDKVNMLSFVASMNKWTRRDDQHDLLDQEEHSTLEKDFPKLERLLLNDKDIRMIQDGKYLDDIFGKPKALTLACFHEKNAVFPPRFLLERFWNLESLEIFCSSFEEIFPDEGLVDEGKYSVLESLGELKLSKLHKLKRVWREDCLVSKVLRSIETLKVWDCPGLTTLFPAAASFKNLTKLVVKNSSGLVQLVTISAVASLVHLEEMTIIGCERMKEVVAKDENRERKVISFGELRWLKLQNMPSLECFSSTTSCVLRFPSLWEIVVEECPKMKIFSKGKLSTPRLYSAKLFRYKWLRDWEGDLDETIQRLSA